MLPLLCDQQAQLVEKQRGGWRAREQTEWMYEWYMVDGVSRKKKKESSFSRGDASFKITMNNNLLEHHLVTVLVVLTAADVAAVAAVM